MNQNKDSLFTVTLRLCLAYDPNKNEINVPFVCILLSYCKPIISSQPLFIFPLLSNAK